MLAVRVSQQPAWRDAGQGCGTTSTEQEQQHQIKSSSESGMYQWIDQSSRSKLCFVGSLADLILRIFCVMVFYEWEIWHNYQTLAYLFIFTVICRVMFQHAALFPLDPRIISILRMEKCSLKIGSIEKSFYMWDLLSCVWTEEFFLAVVQHNVLL